MQQSEIISADIMSRILKHLSKGARVCVCVRLTE